MNSEIIFVYNANSGLINAALDTVHKLISPKTYQCSLCAITYSGANISMDKKWKKFLLNLPIKVTFLHKDQLHKQYPQVKLTKLPAVFTKQDNQLKLLITNLEINEQKTVDDLISLIKQKISTN